MIPAKQKSLAIVPKLTGTLSLLGSLFVLQDIFRDKKKRKSVYHKIMVGLSLFDTMSSITNILSTWPSPASDHTIYGASGTTATCTAQGFFNELGNLTTLLYTAALCVRYLLVVRYNWRESHLEKYEVLFHAIPIAIGTTMGILGLPLNLYNNSGWICWYAPYPAGCTADNSCTRGQFANLFRWLHYGFVWGAILFVTVGMILIYLKVKDQERKAQFLKDQTTATASLSCEASESTMRRISRRLSFTSPSSPGESSEQRHIRNRMTKTKKVAAQASFYVGALYLTWSFTTLTRLIQITQNISHYSLLLLMAIFFPLQGLFNAIIYVRPRYIRSKNKSAHRGTAPRTTLEAIQAVRLAADMDGIDDSEDSANGANDTYHPRASAAYRLGVLEECKSEEEHLSELDETTVHQAHIAQLSSAAATAATTEDSTINGSESNDGRRDEGSRSRSRRSSFMSISTDSSAASRGY